jgi:L-rhamnose mutarotase
MQRVGFLLKVKQELLEEYKEAHKNVWPEMQQALRDAGWTNYTLFAREDGTLFGYVETEDFQKSLAAMDGLEVNTRWQASMVPYFEQLEGQRPDEALQQIEEIFHLD